MPPALLQFLGSLVAILALAGLAWWMKLGPQTSLASEDEARYAANEAVDGFSATEIALDQKGRGALLGDAHGRILLLRPHGTHFAGRILTGEAKAWVDGTTLVIDTAERRYGSARLTIADPQAWVKRIEAIV
ncbi:MAG: hypothetical protein HKO08_12765 [Erythrobacter sp.]|nr:hypothetical protein [Erythrobacter sp.]